LDCSPTNREHGLGRDHLETSTSGTVYSYKWYLGLPEQAMARSYYPLGYG
ncbi:MAG: hypothetical protein J3R72DRAFT_365505, partial [Linnemannia gamsii]